MRKIIFATIAALVAFTNLCFAKEVTQESITGIKPFAAYINTYHYYGKVKHDSWDVDIGKDIKVIEFDGQTIKITKMGILETKGNVIKCGPFLDKNMEPILMSYDDRNLDGVIGDIFTTFYQLKFKGDKNIIFTYNSKTIEPKGIYGLLFWSDRPKRSGIQLTKEQISEKRVSGQISILDDDKQYQPYNIIGNQLVLKHKLAINPDNYDKNLPMLSQMFIYYSGSFLRLHSGYLLLRKDSKLYYDKGEKEYSSPPIMISRNGIYYISTYFLSKRFHYGIMCNDEQGYWKIVKIDNPSLHELSIVELILDKKDKSKVMFNGQEKKLQHEWVDLSTENLNYDPYLSLKEFSEMFGFKYSYRDIDKSVLIP